MNVSYLQGYPDDVREFGQSISELVAGIFEREPPTPFDRLVAGGAYTIIVLFDGVMIASAMIRKRIDHYYLYNFGIVKEYRRQGLGRLLWEKVCFFCGGVFCWDVLVNNTNARLFYLEMGGTVVEETDTNVVMMYEG